MKRPTRRQLLTFSLIAFIALAIGLGVNLTVHKSTTETIFETDNVVTTVDSTQYINTIRTIYTQNVTSTYTVTTTVINYTSYTTH